MPVIVVLDRVDRERREVARIDDLECIGGRARRDELAAARRARGPVGEAIGVVVGADDEAGPDHASCGPAKPSPPACSHSAFSGP